MELSRDRTDYIARIDRLMHAMQQSYDNGTIDQHINHFQHQLDSMASVYQEDEKLGNARYKLYEAQAYLNYFKGNTSGALDFIDEAIDIKGGEFRDAVNFKSMLNNTSQQNESSTSTRVNTLNGIQGWLIWFVIGLCVSVGFSVYNAYESWSLVKGGLTAFSFQSDLDAIFFSLLIIFQVVSIVLIIKRLAIAKAVTIAALAFTIFAYVYDAALAAHIYSYLNKTAPSGTYDNVDRTVVYGIIWILYFAISKRVKQTLVVES